MLARGYDISRCGEEETRSWGVQPVGQLILYWCISKSLLKKKFGAKYCTDLHIKYIMTYSKNDQKDEMEASLWQVCILILKYTLTTSSTGDTCVHHQSKIDFIFI